MKSWMITAACVALSACSGGSIAGTGDGGTDGGSSGTSGGTSGTSGGTSGTPGDGGSEGGASCTPKVVPASAVSAAMIKFDRINTGGGATNAWKPIGFDRDGLCTTNLSTDVCQRVAGADSARQQDGDDGIDNSYGHTITAFFSAFQPMEGAGYVATDGTGSGTLMLTGNGAGYTLNVPLTFAKIVRQGTTATLSAIIPTEAFVAEMEKVAGHISTQLCGGSTLDSIKQTIRQASDMPGSGGQQSSSTTCAAISIGANLVGVADGVAPVVPPGPDPCMP